MNNLGTKYDKLNMAKKFSLASIFHNTSDDFWYWCQTEGIRQEPWLAQLLPKMPSEKIQQMYAGLSGDAAIKAANGFYRFCKQQINFRGLKIKPESRVLDFGCGWGRITRQLLKDVDNNMLTGIDVLEEAVRTCNQSGFNCEFIQISPEPPLYLFDDNSFDYIFSFSLFCHLSEEYAEKWMKELSRLLKPGGVLFATIKPLERIYDCDQQRKSGAMPEYAKGAMLSFIDIEKTVARYQAGHYCFDAAGSSGAELHNYYGEALFSPAYAINKYAPYFQQMDSIHHTDHGLFDQDLLIMQKAVPEKVVGQTFPIADTETGGKVIATEQALPWTGERMVPSFRGPGAVEHLHRYAMACELVEEKVVLDIASGEGYGSYLLAKRAKHVYGVDNAKTAVEHAKNKYPADNLQFLAGTAEAIPLPDQAVDVVVSFETIEHIRTSELFLKEIKRCLKPHGVLIISSPAKGPYNEITPEPNEFHLNEMTHAEFTALLKQQYKNLLIGGQKYLLGSYIMPDAYDRRAHTGTFAGDFKHAVFSEGMAKAAYSIVVCSDAAFDRIPFGVFESKPEIADDMVVQLDKTEKDLRQSNQANDLLKYKINLQKSVISAQSGFLDQTQQQIKDIASSQKSREQFHLEKQKQITRDFEQELESFRAANNKLSFEIEEQKKQWDVSRQLYQQRIELRDYRISESKQKFIRATGNSYYLQHIRYALKRSLIRKITKLVKPWEPLPKSIVQTMGQVITRPLVIVINLWLKKWQTRKYILDVIRASGLFDQEYYLQQYPEVKTAKMDPLKHYLQWGVGQEKNPNMFFNTKFYLTHNPDVAALGMNPLLHFIAFGAAEERDPGPGFDTDYYVNNNPDVLQAGVIPFRHFYLYGIREGRLPKSVVDSGRSENETLLPLAVNINKREFSDSCDIEDDPEFFKKRRKKHGWEQQKTDTPDNPRLIAFYLPQYHPIPENNEWWGEGFTEWENVVRGKSFFAGHDQPHLPADLGFYDLRVSEVREKQAAMAKAFGIHGFCYYYYWFNGKRLLDRPLNEILQTGKPDFPFCICWANENWTRTWDGHDKYILMEQKHSWESDVRFIHDVIPILKDPRYIKFKGEPMLLVYRADKLSTPQQTTQQWRKICAQHGIAGIHLCAVKFAGFDNPQKWGFDALVEFPPNSLLTPNVADTVPGLHPEFGGRISDYRDMRNHSLNYPPTQYQLHRGLMVRWDNTARRRYQSIIFKNSGPEEYEKWLRELVVRERQNKDNDSLIFINAWNEWAEGAHLEPDQRYGYAFLEATSRAITYKASLPAAAGPAQQASGLSRTGAAQPPVPVSRGADEKIPNNFRPKQNQRSGLVLIVHDALSYGVELHTLAIAKEAVSNFGKKVFIVLKRGGELEPQFARYGTVLNLAAMTREYSSETVALEAICKQIKAAGINNAISCTTITGDIAAYFKKHGFNLLTLVNELTTLIEEYGYYELLIQSLNASDKLVFPSQYVYDAYAARYKFELSKKVIKPQGVLSPNPYLNNAAKAKTTIAEKHQLGEKSKIIINVASGDALRKGPDIFLNVAQSVLKKPGMGNIHFIWIGELQGETRIWCQHDMKRIQPAGHVHLVGFQKDVALYMAAADVFALTSREDPFPNVMLSAMEAGLPVIAFENSGGAAELLTRGNGVLVPFLDSAAMAVEIASILADEGRKSAVGQKAMATIKAEYQFEKYVKYLLEQFEPAK